MYKFLFIIYIIFAVVSPTVGQVQPVDSLRSEYDKLYGLDVLLNNGKKYFPDSNPAIGHPFWKNEDSFLGELTLKGRTFYNQQLRFNSNKQEFLLSYYNLNRQKDQIILNSEVIDSVRIGKVLFVPNKNPKIKQRFVQQIYKGNLTCYTGWYKELDFNRTGVNTGYIYSRDKHSNYIIYKGTLNQFSRKSEFLRIFTGSQRVAIRKYLSSNHLRFKKLEETELRKLIIYCEKKVI